jgi:hypothetical protein
MRASTAETRMRGESKVAGWEIGMRRTRVHRRVRWEHTGIKDQTASGAVIRTWM